MTTRLGVRPLGVRGEPLHAVAGQLLSVIRRRLGDGAADLLADPQLRESGDGIDWYAARGGSVQRLAELSEDQRAEVLRIAEERLADIRSLGAQLMGSETSEEARLIGRSLNLSTSRPSDDFVFVVDGEPVIVAWGYEADAAAGLQAFQLATVPPAAIPQAVFASAPAGAMLPATQIVGWAPWVRALLFGLLLLLLLLLTSWLLRTCVPVDPSVHVATLETPAPPAPEAPPDPTPLLKAAFDSAADEERKLKAELASLEAELKDKLAQCKPIEPPKPPPPAPKPQPPKQASAPPVNRPPPGQLPCDWAGDSGGEGVTRNKHYLGDKPGFVALNYQLFQRPDDIKVIYRGQQIAGTGGPRGGRGGFGFDWNPVAGDYSVDVIVTGEQWGTRWNYAIACPRGSRR
ncbi:MAG: hypothetical protein B7Y08_22280 [Rhodospirillales bacterium 24-66-33]|nr:hypothetical protein [Reyranella sp.]OYY38821.1 MAG: hypothetical protein B7Y57_21190 [Rhodospirillales bacterium 35-66-84]OYZ92150.1 MAG: hypothetical protein B7Y08_22280 [Rhodospirillales bacterium 24-66-33]OZB23553.1 MAG: hypothetical protein B7X63_18540 [Rhodospirillales bacterium 39-66-50]HQS15326.1 hypothetical protein [Reyranella sp.]HQT11852.1 hypothetical protein [Reyranella sp.]